MRVVGLLLVLAFVGAGRAGPTDEVELPPIKAWSERSHCPSMDMLNEASRFYHGRQRQLAFVEERYADRRSAAGLPATAPRDDIRQLTASRDFVACEKLNQWFEANILYDVDHVYDADRDEYLPYAYPMYYRIGARYAILFLPYNAGRFLGDASPPPPPTPGEVRVYVFDWGFANLGRFSF